jgi:phosphoadenosine phosphosulfate reductase
MALAEDLQAEYEVSQKGGIVLNTDNDESRRLVEHCYRTTSTMVNPIVDWTDDDVWAFLGHYGCKSNPLYQCGNKRIGCIGCPMQGGNGMKKDFLCYPKYRDNYLRAFGRMLKAREAAGLVNIDWESPEDVMMWWVGDDPRQVRFETPEYLK